jgi:hypothetical protein
LMAFVAQWNAHAHPFNWSLRVGCQSDGSMRCSPSTDHRSLIPNLFSVALY